MRQLIATIAIAGLFCFTALADDKGGAHFESSVIGSTPGITIAGVTAGGVPWVVKSGEASVNSKGMIEVEVKGLVIAAAPGVPANLVGTVGPVTMVAASLVCGGAVAGTTHGVMLSSSGNAEIHDSITLPAMCGAPVVLVRIFNPTTSVAGSYIALSGFTH